MARGRINHPLHIFWTVATAGLWGIIGYAPLALYHQRRRMKRRGVRV